MKRFKIFFGLGAFLMLATTSWGAVPQFINFQGVLRNPGGTPVTDSTYMLTFRIWDQVDPGGNVVWVSVSTPVQTSKGLFNTILLAPELAFTAAQRWLGVTVDKDPPEPELSPRIQLGSVGYSYRVGSVDGATGGNIFGDLTLHSTLTVGDLSGNTGRIEVTDGASNTIVADGTDGKVSATSTGAGDRVAIKGTGNASGTSLATGVSGLGDNSGSGQAIGGSFYTTAAGTGDHWAIHAQADGSGPSVIGVNSFTTNSGAGFALGGNFVATAQGAGEAFGGTFVTNPLGTGVHKGLSARGQEGSLTYGITAVGQNSGVGDAYGGQFVAYGIGGTGKHFGIQALVDGNGQNIANYDSANGQTADPTYGTYSVGHNSLSGTVRGGYFQTTSAGTGNHFAVDGYADGSSAFSIGVNGYARNTGAGVAQGGEFVTDDGGTGTHQGVLAVGREGSLTFGLDARGQNTGTGDAYGGRFVAYGFGGTGKLYGVHAMTTSGGSTNIANYDSANGSTADPTYGTYSVGHNSASGNVYGGFFKTTSSGTGAHIAVYGSATGTGAISGRFDNAKVSITKDALGPTAISIGDRYRDNGIVAWGRVASNGSLAQDFGVTSVTRTAAGTYTIDIDAAALGVGTLIPLAQAVAPSGTVRIVTVTPTDGNTFQVFIYDSTFALTDNDFVFMATAR